MSLPLVSIITPTYNHAPYIGECIQSVLAQEYTHWEMIIMDDGSTDTTREIVENLAFQHPNIRYHRQENIGIYRLSETYNTALAHSNGDFIAILEGDDTWKPSKLRKQIEAFSQNGEAVMCWGKAEGTLAGKILEMMPKHYGHANAHQYHNQPQLSIIEVLIKDFPTPVTWLIKKSTLIEIGGFSQTHQMPAVDLNTILQLCTKGPFIYIDEVLGSWRQFPSQITKSKTVNLMEASEKIFLDFYSKLSSEEQRGIDIKALKSDLNLKKTIAYSRAGRFALLRKEYVEARRYYLQSMTNYSSFAISWKLRSLIGYIFSWLKMDIESLANLLGKKSYRPR